MEYKQHLSYVRYSLRGESAPTTSTAVSSALTEAYLSMAKSDWIRLEEQESNLPPHSYSQPAQPKDTYDACKYCAEWDQNTFSQKAVMTAVCYVMQIPDEAVSSNAQILSVSANLSGDRWLADGAVLSAWLSDFEFPPTFAKIISKTDPIDGIVSSPTPPPEEDDSTSPWEAPLRKKTVVDNNGTDSQCVATLEIGQTAKKYLHLCLRLSLYTSHRKAWIEGGALISGSSIQVSFDSDFASGGDGALAFPLVYHQYFGTGLTPKFVYEFDGKEGCLFQAAPSNSSILPNAVINADVGVIIPSKVDSDGTFKMLVNQDNLPMFINSAMELGSRNDNAANLILHKIRTNNASSGISKGGAKVYAVVQLPNAVDDNLNCDFGAESDLIPVGAGIATYNVGMFFLPGRFDGRKLTGFSLGDYEGEPGNKCEQMVVLVSLYFVRDYITDFTRVEDDGSSVSERHIISPGFYYRDWDTISGAATELPVLPCIPNMSKYDTAHVPMEHIASFETPFWKLSRGYLFDFSPKYVPEGKGALVVFIASRYKGGDSWMTSVNFQNDGKVFKLY